MTASCLDAKFDARILSLCLDNFLVQHSVQATRSVPGQRDTCLDLVFTNPSEDILPFDRGPSMENSDHLSICFDNVHFSCTNPSDKRHRNTWKSDFEGMRCHLQINAALVDLVEISCPLAQLKRPLTQAWISRRIVAMQKQKKKLLKYSCLYVLKSTRIATNAMAGLTSGLCGVPGQFMNRASSSLPSVIQKPSLGMFVKVQKRPYPRVEEARWLH